MNLVKNREYFIGVTDVILRESSKKKAKGKNHLLFGDWLKYLGEETASRAKIKCRGDIGWIPKKAISDSRKLEVNFVDIGQGDGCHIVTPDDKVILVDAGMHNNMHRFLNWRYNLRRRKVAGVDDVAENANGARKPFPIDHVIISHPDKDHYYGFKDIFESKKIKVLNIYHNGVVERPIKKEDKEEDLLYPSKDDLGGYIQTDGKRKYLWDVVRTNKGMHSLIKKHKGTRKNYLQTLEEARTNNIKVKFTSISTDDHFIGEFDQDNALTLKVLGPITEKVTRGAKTQNCLRKLGDEGVTKNGHSIVMQLQIGRLKVMLGGDLNTESEDYLLRHYGGATFDVSKLEKKVKKLKAKGHKISESEKQKLAEAEADIHAVVTKARQYFRSDITKACHHGSHHFSETFLKTLDAIVTVVSSGDNESYAHPRPDALGSFGKYGRGERPLIFSTELARSTAEFTSIGKYLDVLKEYDDKIAAATTERKKKRLQNELEGKKDRNVVVYGMITLRTDGETIVLAQKLESPGKGGRKWDIHELTFNQNTLEFEYLAGGSH